MKKFIVLLLMMIGTLTAHAADYTYLTFETTDGAKVSVEASSLSITISGTTLTAGSQKFTLSNLSKMYFSTSNETTGLSEELKVKSEEFATAIYDLQGRKVTKDEMRSGQVYIVKTKSGTHKIAVK
jgi:hypothetical protein